MRPEHWLYTIPLRLRSLFRWAQADQGLDDELRDHLERKTEEYVAQGMTQEEAHRRARLDLDGIEQTKEKCRDARRLNWIHDLIQDLHYGVRMLRKSPGFTTIAVLTLALGIGANTAIFSLIHAVMLRMLPVPQAEQLVLLSWVAPGHPYMIHSLSGNFDRDKTGNFTSTSFSYPIFQAIHDRNLAFSGVLAFAEADTDRLNVSVGGLSELAQGQLVSGDSFSTLGIHAAIGRTILPSDDKEGASPVAVASYSYWVRRFGRDPLAVGKEITVNGVPFTLVGVAAPDFFGVQAGTSMDVWIPLRTQPQIDPGWTAYANPGEVSRFTARDDWWVSIIGRLKPSASLQEARAALDVIVQQNSAGIELPPTTRRSPDIAVGPPEVELTPAGGGLDALRREFSQPLFVLMFIVGLVLLIACGNIANLLLARAGSRQKEIAVRLALGAARQRLIRQLLTESVLLALSGGAFGVILAYWATGVLLTFMSSGRTPVILHVSPNLGVLGFTAAVSVLTGILFGLAPALRCTRPDLTPALKEGGAKMSSGGLSRGPRLDPGNVLMVAQIAMSLILLVGAGLFVRTLRNLQSRNIGFDRRNLLLFGIDPTQVDYKSERLASFYEELRHRIESLPGVRSATLSRHTFINGGVTIAGVSIQGYTPKPGESNNNGSLNLHVNSVGAGFFETFGIPLFLGRTLNERDTAAAPKIGVVNSAFARKYLGASNPIGRRFGFGDQKASSDVVIVGVVGDALYGQLRDEALPTIYVPYVQNIQQLAGMTFEVRTEGDPSNSIAAVRQAVRGLDGNLPLFNIKTQTEEIQQASFQERLFSRLSSFFALLALALASVGLYGMTSYAVSRRTSEIGIRMALGARRVEILTLIVGQRLTFALIGVGAGIVGALGLTHLMSSLLYGVKANDPLTFTTVSLILTVLALVASYIPARQAMRVDPMIALRYE